MKRKAYLITVMGLLATFGVVGGSIGIVDTAEASSSGSHSRHSLAGRSFKIDVKDLDLGTTRSNCYDFEEGGVWIDPLFLEGFVIPGTWVQHTGGFHTRYTAFARTPFPLDLDGDDIVDGALRLIQNGSVYPSYYRGKLRLRAYSTLVLEVEGFGDVVIGNFLSKGYSVDKCPAVELP